MNSNNVETIKPILKESYAKKIRSPFERLKTKLKKNIKAGRTEGLKETMEKLK